MFILPICKLRKYGKTDKYKYLSSTRKQPKSTRRWMTEAESKPCPSLARALSIACYNGKPIFPRVCGNLPES